MARTPRGIATVCAEDPASLEFASVETLVVGAPVPTRVTPDPMASDARREGGDPPGGAAGQGRSPDADPTEGLVGPLVREMNDAWRRGECYPVEDYLARIPSSSTTPRPRPG